MRDLRGFTEVLREKDGEKPSNTKTELSQISYGAIGYARYSISPYETRKTS